MHRYISYLLKLRKSLETLYELRKRQFFFWRLGLIWVTQKFGKPQGLQNQSLPSNLTSSSVELSIQTFKIHLVTSFTLENTQLYGPRTKHGKNWHGSRSLGTSRRASQGGQRTFRLKIPQKCCLKYFFNFPQLPICLARIRRTWLSLTIGLSQVGLKITQLLGLKCLLN